MAEVTAKDVAALRKLTGAGILDCRRALEENDCDMEKSTRWLREQGLLGASKRAGRERSEGAVAVVVNGKHGAVVSLECETDFVAKSADFVSLVDSLADACASDGEAGITKYAAEIDQIKLTLKENIAVGRHEQFVAGDDAVLDSYLHVQNGRGVNGVLVELAGGTAEIAHDIAVHIAFARPEFLSREDVPPAAIEQEKETIAAIALKEGKPEAQLEKIVEGRLNGWFKERVLLEQAFARDEKKSISQLLNGAEIRRFAQVVVGA
jgi:elongation factor Ts